MLTSPWFVCPPTGPNPIRGSFNFLYAKRNGDESYCWLLDVPPLPTTIYLLFKGHRLGYLVQYYYSERDFIDKSRLLAATQSRQEQQQH
jgi:hypothetical protein